jgi:hypothetical protein
VAALVLARRRHRVARVVDIVETASLGPRRSLVVARVGDELLLLGSSEGGIALLATRPASLLARACPDPVPRREREPGDERDVDIVRLPLEDARPRGPTAIGLGDGTGLPSSASTAPVKNPVSTMMQVSLMTW